MSALARDVAGNRDWRGGPPRGRRRTTRGPRSRCARPTPSGPRGRAPSWSRPASSRFPTARECLVEPSPVFQRPVLGVASYIGAAGVLRIAARATSSCRSRPTGPPRRRARSGCRQLARRHPHRLGPRGVPGPPLAPGDAADATPSRAAGLLDARTSARAGRCTRSASCASAASSGPIHELYHLEATHLPGGADRRRHLPPPGRDELRRGGRLHAATRPAMPEPTARAEVGRYCWWPTQASSYLTGCLEILASASDGWRRAASRRVAEGRLDRGAARVPRRARDLGRPAAGPRRARRPGDASVDTLKRASRRPA